MVAYLHLVKLWTETFKSRIPYTIYVNVYRLMINLSFPISYPALTCNQCYLRYHSISLGKIKYLK